MYNLSTPFQLYGFFEHLKLSSPRSSVFLILIFYLPYFKSTPYLLISHYYIFFGNLKIKCTLNVYF
jgi:hypothetical protein